MLLHIHRFCRINDHFHSSPLYSYKYSYTDDKSAMEAEQDLEKGRLKMIKGLDHRPVSSLAVQVVASERKKAFIMDGSRTVNPYFIVRECKREGLNEKEILRRIMMARTFTAYQYIDLLEKAKEELKDRKTIFLGAVAPSPLFEDEEMSQEEGRWLRSRSIKMIKKLVKEEGLYGVIVDPEAELLQKRRSFQLNRESDGKKYMNHSSVSSIG